MHMRSFTTATLRRKAIATFGLALFLLGSNYCLVGALLPGGQAMACLAPAGASGKHETRAAQPACHTTPESAEDAPAPALPCCIALAPVVPPQLDKHAPEILAASAVLAYDVPAPRVPDVSGAALRAPPESPPPLAAPRALASPRAPPIA
jgi:hypothetical protein